MKLLLSKKIKYTDLELIASLFVGNNAEIHVFDPNGKVIWDQNGEERPIEYENKILFNFGGELIRFKEYELSEFDCIVDFGQKIKLPNYTAEKLNLILSPAGIVRYIFNSNDRKFQFLDFLQTPTRRAKLIKFGVQSLLRLNCISLIGMHFHVLSQSKLAFKELLKEESYDNYALFLGTPGFWRKPVVQLSKGNKVTHYAKIATTPQTQFLIRNEARSLSRIKAYELKQLKFPIISPNSNSTVLVQNINALKQPKRIREINNALFLSLKELTMNSMKHSKIEETSFYSEILDQMTFLKNQSNLIDTKTYHYLKELKNSLARNQYTKNCIAHGDFTPWNIIQNNNITYAYDWEMAVFDAPVFYDAFHFIYQAEILVNRNGISGIEKQLERFFKQTEVAEFVKRYNINLKFHHALYLLHVISKNLILIGQQAEQTQDQRLLLMNYKEALIRFPLLSTQTENRETFLEDLQLFLADKKYAALKFFLPDFKSLPIKSDLDLAIEKTEITAVELFVEEHLLVKRHSKVEKSFMSTSQLHFADGSFLSIDFISDFIRKGKRYMNMTEILSNATLENGVSRPALFHDIEYTQHFYTLNNSSIPLKYQHIFTQLLTHNNQTENYLDRYNKTYKLSATSLTETFNFASDKKQHIQKYLNHTFQKMSLDNLRRKLTYLRDFMVDIKDNKGYMITFSGVDGAGKTTIIKAVKEQLEQTYRKEIILLRHRPRVLPILSALKYGGVKKAEQKAGETIPRQGDNKNKISSYIRFGYYFTDYLFGQIYVYAKYVLRGKVVIYDRYYYDFINDSKRSNIKLNNGLIKRLFAFIYKPKFNFYLYNDPEVIRARKQELNVDDIQLLNQNYATLFNELESKNKGIYYQIKNDIQAETIAEIFNQINKVA